jgi:hypothetical protein
LGAHIEKTKTMQNEERTSVEAGLGLFFDFEISFAFSMWQLAKPFPL